MVLRVPILAVALSCGSAAFAGQAHTPGEEARPIFRLSVSLIQLDAVVTDRKGQHVPDLGPDDFEVLQDGQPQRVTAAVYVKIDDFAPTSPMRGQSRASTPSRSPRVEDARRTIAVVVDDLRMSFTSIYYTRRALRRFVAEDLRPDDLAGVTMTSGAHGFPESLTFRRAELGAIVDRISFNLSSQPWNAGDGDDWITGGADWGRVASPPRVDRFIEWARATDALSRIADVINTVQVLPGRKAIVLMSEGFSIAGLDAEGGLLRDALRRLVDRANRAGVVIYAVDPRGLVNPSYPSADQRAPVRFSSFALSASQDGLHFIAGETGGFAVVNANDLHRGLVRIMNDQRGYYLIGYEPDADTFGVSSRDYRNLRVKVKRKGLKVRARRGFYAVPTQ
jgi:VWFA-related protein